MNGLKKFWLVVAILALIRLALPFIAWPVGAIGFVNVVLAITFVGLPVFALFGAAEVEWTPKRALPLFLGGVLAHALCVVLVRSVVREGAATSILDAVAQSGILCWCCGLGALVSSLIKDRNLLPPVAMFLAGFDMFIIFTPKSLPQQVMQKAPAVFHDVASKVPSVAATPAGGITVMPGAYIGPADFIFISMFFVALFRFGMRTRTTLLTLIPVLICYLGLVLFGGGLSIGPISLAALPALLPIGLTILFVNWGEFRMDRQEKIGTAFAAVLGLSLAIFGVVNAAKAERSALSGPVGPSTLPADPATPGSAGSPAPAPSGQPQ